MCVIILLQTFDQTGTAAKITMLDPEDATIYQGFNANWYHLESNELCFAILMSSLISNFTEIKQLTLVSANQISRQLQKTERKKWIWRMTETMRSIRNFPLKNNLKISIRTKSLIEKSRSLV